MTLLGPILSIRGPVTKPQGFGHIFCLRPKFSSNFSQTFLCQPQNCFGKTKVYLLWETKIVLMENQKWQKQFEFEKLKISNPDILPFWQIFNFSNSIFFVIFGFPLKKYFFLRANILLSYQKYFWADSINREEEIL